MRSAITDGVVFSGTITSNVRGQIIFRAFVLLSVNRDMTKLNGRFRRGATLFFFFNRPQVGLGNMAEIRGHRRNKNAPGNLPRVLIDTYLRGGPA